MFSLIHVMYMSQCTPNQQLSFCQNEIRDIADTIEFSVLQNPEWKPLFTIDGIDVSETLNKLADKLQSELINCPCIGTCTHLSSCTKTSVDISDYNSV